MIKKIILLILLFFTVILFQEEAKSQVKINSVLFDNSEAGMYLFTGEKILPEDNVSVTSGKLDDNRVYFDVHNAIITHPNKTWEFKHGTIEKVRLSQFTNDPATVRLVFYYKDGFAPEGVKVLKAENVIIFKYNNRDISGEYYFNLYREEPGNIPDYFEALTMSSAQKAVTPTAEQTQNIDAGIAQIENAIGVMPVSFTQDAEIFNNYKLKSKFFVDKIEVKQGNILIYGVGHTAIQKPFPLSEPSRLVIDLPNTVLKAELREKELSINETEKVKIAQFDQTTTRIVITTPSPEKYRTIFSSNLQSLLISHDDRIKGVNLFNETAPIDKINTYKLSDAMNVLSFTFKAPLIHSIKNNKDFIEIILYNTDGITQEILANAFQNSPLGQVKVNRFSNNGYRIWVPIKQTTKVGAWGAIDGRHLKISIKTPPVVLEKPTFPKAKQQETITVVIDPGHGGSDIGATRSGINEKDLNLDVAKKLANYLISQGINVEMTHWQDETQSLQERVDFAQAKKADIFVSVHANASNKPEIHGIETHYYHNYSRNLADLVQDELIAATKAHSRGVLQSKFYVINHTTMPAILVEIGFISNNNERNNLLSEKRKQQTAEAIANGILEFLKSK